MSEALLFKAIAAEPTKKIKAFSQYMHVGGPGSGSGGPGKEEGEGSERDSDGRDKLVPSNL